MDTPLLIIIDSCAAKDRSRAAQAYKSRLPIKALRSLAMQGSAEDQVEQAVHRAAGPPAKRCYRRLAKTGSRFGRSKFSPEEQALRHSQYKTQPAGIACEATSTQSLRPILVAGASTSRGLGTSWPPCLVATFYGIKKERAISPECPLDRWCDGQ